jgi:hypothetical protein
VPKIAVIELLIVAAIGSLRCLEKKLKDLKEKKEI